MKEAKNADTMTIARLSYVLIQSQAPMELVRSLLQMAQKHIPADPQARKELGGVLAAAKLSREALALYDGLPLTFEEERQLVNIHVAAGDLNDAIQRMDKLREMRPDDADLRLQLADVLSWSKRYDEAAKVYEELLKADPNSNRLLTSLAQIHVAASHYDLALSFYRKALSADPDLISCYPGYIDAAACASGFDPGTEGATITRIVDWARREHATDLVLLKRVTWVCQRAKDRETAVALLKITCKLDPQDIRLVLELADTYYEMGRYAEAETHYLRAAHRDWNP
jgi:tetratricopeptide (TPR) repeat protein